MEKRDKFDFRLKVNSKDSVFILNVFSYYYLRMAKL